MPKYDTNSSTLERESKEPTPLEASEAYYFACRSMGFAEHAGAYFKGAVDASPEDYFYQQYHSLGRDGGLFDFATEGRKGIARARQKAQMARDLLEDLTYEDLENPKMTICIPVAINSESPERLHELLGNVKKSQQDFGETTQVMLWANAQSDAPTADRRTEKNYAALRDIAAEYADANVQIKTGLDILPADSFSMSRLRQRYMDAFVCLAIEKGYDADHVVTWLDADTVSLGKDYLGKLYDQTRENELGFVHPRTDYVADWASGENKSRYDDATRAFLANEIINRTERNERGVNSYEYTEESGLTFTYLTFLLSGGCDTSNPIDESEGLMNGLRTSTTLPFFESLRDLYAAHADDRLNVTSPIDREIGSARAALSGRRTYRNIKSHGVAAMPSDRLGGAVNGEYHLFTQAERNDQGNFDANAAREYLEQRRRALKSKVARDAIARVLQSLYGK